MNDNIDEYVKKTYRYYYDDGLVEIAIGLLLAIVGLGLFAWLKLDPSPFFSALLFLGILSVIIAGVFLIRQIVLKLKERFTYVRSGYLSYRPNEPDRSRWFLVVVSIALVVTLLFLPEEFNQMQFGFGLFLGATLCFLGYRLKLRRFYVVGFAAILIGVAAAVLTDDEINGVAFVLLSSGVLLTLSGGLTLAHYLRQYPGPSREQV